MPNFLHGQLSLIQHLDASEEGSLVTGANGVVTEWKDQSSNGNNGTPSAGSIYKVQDGEISWLDFGATRNVIELFSPAGSDAWLDQSGGTGGFCVILSFKTTAFHSDWNDLFGNSSAVTSGFGLRYSNKGEIKAYLGGKVISFGLVEVGDAIVLAFNYNALTGQYEYWNSKLQSSTSGTIQHADFSLSDAVSLGSTNNSSRFYKGYVGEVKIFSQFLSDNDFQNERDGLYLKWVAANREKDPPTPNPAAFSIAPMGVSSSIISMTATRGSDMNGPVEYLFTETTGNQGGSASGWQTNPNYRDGDLTPLTEYSYTVTIRDGYGNEGSPSAPGNATTLDYVEPGQENELEYGAYYGYQGWHFAEGDGRKHSNEWVHWFENGIPDAVHIHGDMWPDLREYDTNKLYETMMKYPSGETVKTYSSHDYSTIDLHVKWMKEYGIVGCAVQRFTSAIDQSDKLEQGDKKLRDFMTACEKYDVKFWIMHDSGKGDAEEYDRITNDWKHLVNDLDVLQSPAYTYQNGLPVYGLWGLGVSTREWTPDGVAEILDFYQKGEEQYRTYVVAGVPVNWRTEPPAGWNVVYDRLDMISPWRTIFNDPDKFKSRMQADFEYCNSKGIDYNPVVSPGASTLHLRDSEDMRNWKPRDGGHFLWKQVYEVCKMGSKFMYVAMFDEVDEGTAMYKLVETTADLPLDAYQVPLNEDGYDLPSDWYLQIGTEMQKMLEGSIPLTQDLPLTFPATSISDEVDFEPLKVYPVPAGDFLFIGNSMVEGVYKIIGLDGVVLLQGVLDQNNIRIASLESGIYLLQLNEKVITFVKR